jgi:hypothetical protein
MNNGNIVLERCINCGIIKKPSFHLGKCVVLTTGNVNKSWDAASPYLLNTYNIKAKYLWKEQSFIMVTYTRLST